MPNFGSRAWYDQSVVSLESLEKVRGAIGHFQSLLRRGALIDALEIFSADLESQLRFRLGELRVLKSLVSQVQATYLRLHGTLTGAPLRSLAAELLLHEGHARDALAVLDDINAGAEVKRCRAVALFELQRFDEAYREAQEAGYDTLQWLAATAGREYTALQLLAEKPALDHAEALIGHRFFAFFAPYACAHARMHARVMMARPYAGVGVPPAWRAPPPWTADPGEERYPQGAGAPPSGIFSTRTFRGVEKRDPKTQIRMASWSGWCVINIRRDSTPIGAPGVP